MLSLLCYGIHWNKFHQSLLYHKFFSMKYVYIYIWIHISHFRWMVLIDNILCFIIMFFSLPYPASSLLLSQMSLTGTPLPLLLFISLILSLSLYLYTCVYTWKHQCIQVFIPTYSFSFSPSLWSHYLCKHALSYQNQHGSTRLHAVQVHNDMSTKICFTHIVFTGLSPGSGLLYSALLFLHWQFDCIISYKNNNTFRHW